jgi:hypothetical protein
MPCRRARRLLALVQLAAFLPACTSWQVQPASPADVLATQRPERIRVIRADSSDMTLRNPEIHGDTLYGVPSHSTSSTGPERASIPLAKVEQVAVLRPDNTKSTLFAVGLAVVTFGSLCLLADELGCGEESFLVPAGRVLRLD